MWYRSLDKISYRKIVEDKIFNEKEREKQIFPALYTRLNT